MPKPALKISFLFEQGSRRPEVTTICTGDINGDGIKEIIYGGGIGEHGGSQVSVRKSISQNEVPITQINVGGSFIKQTICFDVNNDGMDEIICGNTKNEIFILMSSNDRLVQSNSISLKNEGPINQISDIKAIKFNEIIYILACSTCGNLSVIGVTDNKLNLVSSIEIPFECFSILPVIWREKLILLIGGVSCLSVFEVNNNFSLNKLDEMFFPDLVIDEDDKEDSIYDIILFDTQEDYFRFFCGCRSKNLIFFKFSKEIEFISDFSCEGSIYSISRGDIDRFGKNELIVTGIIRNYPEVRGFIQIFKIENGVITPICFYEYKQRIFSAQPFFDKETDRDYILISAEGEEFICLKIIYFDEICEIISKLGTNLKKFPGEYCFFVGAGLSFPIFPSADDLSKKLIEKSKIPRENIIEDLLNNEKTKTFLQDGVGFPERIPLEAILFWYKNQFSRRDVIGFLLDNLNHKDKEIPNHFIIIRSLMKNSFINYVFTVNYDLLLESVLDDVESLITENDFISTKICQKNAILKLHGSIEKSESIEASLDEVGQIGKNKKTVLEFLFSGHTVFFVGYSCRDPDLYPALKNIVHKYGTSCYFVDPYELSEQAKEVLKLSGNGDINLRHLQVPAGLFFDYLISKMDIGKDNDVNLNEKEVK